MTGCFATSHLAKLIGIAKPMFCAPGTTAVVIPTTSPHRLSSGPPELPGLIGVSIWINGS